MSNDSHRRLGELRQLWGKTIERSRDMGVIGSFHAAKSPPRETVDPATWADLDLDGVFAAADRTCSMPGRQVLYDQLRTYERDPTVLAERARQYQVFRDDAALRERLQLQLDRLDGRGAAYIGSLLLESLPPTPTFAWLLYILSVVTPLCLIGGLFIPHLFAFAVPLVLVNAAIYYTYGQRIAPYFSGFSQLTTLLTVGAGFATVPDVHELPQLARLRQNVSLIARLRRRLGWLSVDRNAMPELVASLFGYINMLCLVDIVVFLGSIRHLRTSRSTLVEIFEAVGGLDAAISVASYTSGPGTFVTPELRNTHHLEVAGLWHPLIPHPVANDLTLVHQSALIAGPNMAGKTAFIRTIGLNLVLAQTLHLCCAQRAIFPQARVRSAIRREDRLSDGESYFFAEIKQVMEFTEIASGPQLHVFLIDEIFRGTNTVERIACSAAVLRALAKRQLVLATTHDIELQELLADCCAMYHFADRIVDGHYSFDYRICAGAVRSRNAIKLLALTGYASSIVAEAERLVGQFEAQKRASDARSPLAPPT
jgi:hypothetical protein